MEQSEARQILNTLAQGLDPSSGARLEVASVCTRKDVVAALVLGISALDAEALRQRRRAQLPQNLGRPWSEEEEQRLGESFRAGQDCTASPPSIGAHSRRSRHASSAWVFSPRSCE